MIQWLGNIYLIKRHKMDIKEIAMIVNLPIDENSKEALIIDHIAQHEKAFETIKYVYDLKQSKIRQLLGSSVTLIDQMERTKDVVGVELYSNAINAIIESFKNVNKY